MSRRTVPEGKSRDAEQSTAELLDAGAILPATAGSAGGNRGGGDRTDVLSARAYRHPALADRTVVRLVPAALGEAEDLSMEFLGFERPGTEDVAPVGVVLRKSLGFPAWALVNDPANGHHALALVKEIERLGRVAKSKPGNARDGFDELAGRLAASVPHFLPSFYEQAGRAFLAVDNKPVAATMFGKARDAERSYGLDVDEDLMAASFLEFALNGALTAKSVGEYAKALAARTAPDEAFRRFRQVVLERSAGGLPPYAGLAADMKRLAKAAGLDAAAEEVALLRVLLASPSTARAPRAFWAGYRNSLVKAAVADPSLVGRLLALNPTLVGTDSNAEGDRFWLALLQDCGALDVLADPEAPAGSQPSDGVAGWLQRFSDNRNRGWRWYGSTGNRMPELLTLVQRIAPRLIAEGIPLRLTGTRQADIDLIDLCVSLGIALEAPESHWNFDVAFWLADKSPGRRDLLALAEDGDFGPALVRSLGQMGHRRWTPWQSGKGTSPIVSTFPELSTVPGMLVGLRNWLGEQSELLSTQGLPGAAAPLSALTGVATPEIYAVHPDAVRAVADFDVATLLATALRTGIFDEYGWPALEQACTDMGAAISAGPRTAWELVEQWPGLLVRSGARIAVVSGGGVIADHTINAAAAGQSVWHLLLRHADGQLLVQWSAYQNEGAYWSGDPLRQLTWRGGPNGDAMSSMALPSGGRTAGRRPLRAGDTDIDEVGDVVSDGTTYWRLASDADATWQEYDPETGAAGRRSLPKFFETGLADGDALRHRSSMLRPAPAGTEASPLGTADGLLGWRVRVLADGTVVGDGVDGRSWHGNAPSRGQAFQPGGLLSFPGTAEPALVLRQHSPRHRGIAGRLALTDGEGRETGWLDPGTQSPEFACGTLCVPPLWFWHFLVARDLQGSGALRLMDSARARGLMNAVRGGDFREAVPVLGPLLPEVTHPGLLAGIAGYVLSAVARDEEIGKVRAALDATTVEPAVDDAHDPRFDGPAWDETLAQVCNGLGQVARGYHHQAPASVGACLRWIADAVAGRGPELRIEPRVVAGATELLAALPSLIYRAASPATSAEQRASVSRLVAAASASRLLAAGRAVRTVQFSEPDTAPKRAAGDVIRTANGLCIVFYAWPRLDNGVFTSQWTGLQITTGDTFDVLPEATVTGSARVPTWPDGVLDRIVRLLDGGPFEWDPAAVERLHDATGMTNAEAGYLVSGFPAEEACRSFLGLGTREYKAAAGAFQQRTTTWSAHLDRLLGDAPAELWEHGPDVDALAAWWVERRGKQTPVPDELVTEAHAALSPGHGYYNPSSISATAAVRGIANAESWSEFQPPAEGQSRMGSHEISIVVKALIWLNYRLPGGDPLRAKLPVAADLVRRRLTDPATSIQVGSGEGYEDIAAALGVTPVAEGREVVIGPFRAVPHNAATTWNAIHLRPGALSGPDDPALDAAQAYGNDDEAVATIRLVLDGTLAALASAPIPDGTAQDPSVSVPHVVTAAADRLGLSQDAATLYLMLLSLPDPTDKNQASWTGWKPARLKAARAELAATDLVVAGTRPRAGRTLFLPGGWHSFKAPLLPVETWKDRWIGVGGDGGAHLGLTAPRLSVPALFEAAWQRVVDDDGPRLTELTTARNRRTR